MNHRDIASVMVELCVVDGFVQAESIHGTILGRTPEQRLESAGWSRRWMVVQEKEKLNNGKPYGRYRGINAPSEAVEARVNPAYYAEHFNEKPYLNTYGGRIIATLNDGTRYDLEPRPYLGCRMSDGSINTASYPQLVEKMRAQAPLAGITAAKQARIFAVITALEEQPTVQPLLASMTR